ncbi:renalase-like isoform X2 [Tigriopus californicus]|uniref:renalase-like isoform X2 n=1 Tax=Tigriopus californicus TaxID=6832 RepID=UPI0027DAA0E0|nr:renalase-like isoform X2 [Tigriopus californicus]
MPLSVSAAASTTQQLGRHVMKKILGMYGFGLGLIRALVLARALQPGTTRTDGRSDYEALVAAGLLAPLQAQVLGMKPMDEAQNHYVAPRGCSSLVKHYLAQAKCEVGFGHHVSEVTRHQAQWTVKTQNGVSDQFDVVVLTMPLPQVLALGGSIQDTLKEQHNGLSQLLQDVQYSARYALGYFYDEPVDLKLDFDAQYIQDDPVLRFVSVDNRKRGLGPDSPTSLVFHTSVSFGLEHVESTPQALQAQLVACVRARFPDLPEPKHVKCQKWRYSQVSRPLTGMPGFAILERQPLLIVGGDGLTHSNFDGCLKSAKAVAAQVLASFKE